MKMQAPGTHYKVLKLTEDDKYDIFTYTFKDEHGIQMMFPGTSVYIPEISVGLRRKNDWSEETYFYYYYNSIVADFLCDLLEAKDISYDEIDKYFTKMIGMQFHCNLIFSNNKDLKSRVRKIIDERNERNVENLELFKSVNRRDLTRTDVQLLSKRWDALFSVATKRSKSFRELEDKQENKLADNIAKIIIAAKDSENG